MQIHFIIIVQMKKIKKKIFYLDKVQVRGPQGFSHYIVQLNNYWIQVIKVHFKLSITADLYMQKH